MLEGKPSFHKLAFAWEKDDMNDLWILFLTSMMIVYAVMFEMALSEMRDKHKRLGRFATLMLVLVWIP